MTMKKYMIVFILILTIPLFATYRRHDTLLDGTLAVVATTTATNGSEFTSKDLITYDTPYIGVTAIFTRAAGSALTIDFTFEVSFDNGTTWATFKGVDVKVATNTAAVTGTTVRVFYEMAVYGASHIRLKSVKNNDTANNITAVNVIISR